MPTLLTIFSTLIGKFHRMVGWRSAKSRLLEAEERWQLALRVNHDGIWDWDIRNRRYFYSRRWREMFGYDETEEIAIKPANSDEFFHPDDKHLSHTIRAGIGDGKVPRFDIEFRHRCKNGTYTWIRCRGEAIHNAKTGELERLIGLNTDISEQKEAERALAERVQLSDLSAEIGSVLTRDLSLTSMLQGCAQALVQHLDAAFARIWTLNDRDDVLELQASAGMYTHLNGSHSRIAVGDFKIGKIALERRPHLTNSVVSDPRISDREWAKREGIVSFAGYPLLVNDRVVGVMAVFARRPMPDVALRAMAGVADGIAVGIERVKKDAALLQNRDQMMLLTAALESAANGVVITDAKGTIEWVNPAFAALTGYSVSEAMGKSTRLLKSGKNSDTLYSGLWQTITNGDVWHGELVNRRKDGSLYDEEMTITPVRDSSGSIAHFIAIKQEITDRKHAEEQVRVFNQKLQQSNRELQDFAYVASHDLQEPLRKVQTFADRFATKYSGALDATGLDYLERMRNAASRMQILIQDLLSFSRVTTKAQPFEPVDIDRITREVLSDLEVKIEETGATFEIDDLPTIDADGLQMRQLIQNLVGNALKFRRNDVAPLIRINAKLSGGSNGNGPEYVFTVEDNGIGFDEKYTDRIFTVFQRLHGRAEYEGSGIGLAVCRKIVERHHGEITARSTPGEGSRFVFTLPEKQHLVEVS